MFYFTGSTNAQDTICTRDKYCFAAKIYSVDHKVVWFKYAEGEAGILQHLPFNRLIKIKYAGGEDIFFYTFLKQASLGFSFYTNGNSTHQVFQGRSEEIYSSLSSSGALFTFIYRGTVAGISLSTGYAYTVTKLRSVSTYSYPPYSSTTSDHTSMTPYNNIPLLFSPRFCMGKSNTCPFFDVTIGTEFYQRKNGQVRTTSPFICRTGFGISFLFLKFWQVEAKVGFGSRSDFKDEYGKNFLIGNFEIGIYRMLYSRISH